MMKSEMSYQDLKNYTKSLRDRLNQLETELENFSGPDNKPPTDDGMDLVKKFLGKRSRNTSIKYTSGPNTITIHTTSTPPRSDGTSSNTTTETSSSSKMEDGSSKVTSLTSWLPWTLPIPPSKRVTTPPSWW